MFAQKIKNRIKYSTVEEKRLIPRWKTDKLILCRNIEHENHDCWEVRATDFNTCGIGINTFRDLSVGQKMSMEMKILGKNSLILYGEVMWIESKDFHNRAGIHFYNTNQEAFTTIAQYIDSYYDLGFRHHIFDGWK